MSTSRVFLVVPTIQEVDFREFVSESVAPQFRDYVHIFTDGSKSNFSTDVNENVAKDVIGSLEAFSADAGHHLIVHRDAKCSAKALSAWGRHYGFAKANIHITTQVDMKRLLTNHWFAKGVHWRSHAERQIGFYDGVSLKLDAWLQQFGELKSPKVGRKLASQLRVVRPSQMPTAPFGLRPADILGQNDAYCYVVDDDQGGSWVDIQAYLMHNRPKGTVFPVSWDKQAKTLTFPDVQVDKFVLYEDGLWSGSETVRRLEAMHKNPPSAPVTMRFGIVSDFGLRICRHAIRKFDLSARVSIETSASELMYFLRRDLPGHLELGEALTTEEYFIELHDYVGSGGLESSSLWTDAEREFCENVGAQLVTQWLGRKSGAQPSEKSVSLFAMGGGGFASTTLFSRSVPKVCLPLLWLDGVVAVGSLRVTWKPLFVDARRVADANLLCIDS